MRMKIFVYGTLKEGGRFGKLFDDVRISSKPATIKNYDLYDLGSFPGIIDGHGEVHGEVHEFPYNHDILKRMDCIEGYNPNRKKSSLYLRINTFVHYENGSNEPAFVYVLNTPLRCFRAKLIKEGLWRIYGNEKKTA